MCKVWEITCTVSRILNVFDPAFPHSRILHRPVSIRVRVRYRVRVNV